jgi:nicotinamidase-related amidase
MKRLLVVVDYQNDFVGGSLGFPGAELLDGPIAEKIKQYKESGDDVVYTMDTHGPGYLEMQEGKRLPVIHCQNGTEGWKLYGETGKLCEGCMTIGKHAFGSFDLAEWAMMRGYDQIELCGLVSYICVISNAVLIKTAQPEAEIIVDAACTAGPDPKLNEECLDIMEKGLQITILNRK